MPHSTIFVEEQYDLAPHIKGLDTTQVLFIGYTQNYNIEVNEEYPTISSLNDFIAFYGDKLMNEVNDFVQSYLYHSVELFFANGGRNCKIISINKKTNIVNIDIFLNALDELNNTNFNIVCCPDTNIFSHQESKYIHNHILKICAKKNSMYIVDLPLQNIIETYDLSYFYEKYLSYGATYAPWIITTSNTERKKYLLLVQ